VAASPDAVKVFAPAKINLFLHVGERRSDGYHALESLVVFADVGDELLIEPAHAFSLALDGPFGGKLAGGQDNLIAKAARALAAKVGRSPNVKITLTKNLPVASGIGGGSADAAATLRGLVQFWDLKIPQIELHAIAEALGSDVPACLLSETLWMTGRGEGIDPIPGIPPAPLVLVNPGVAVSTAQIFANLKTRVGVGQAAKPKTDLSVLALADYFKSNRNDLENPARDVAPAIDEVLKTISHSGALRTRMSGSGATCFGLFADDQSAHAAAAKIAEDHPNWWVKKAKIISLLTYLPTRG
jgi:4-diphosphocytidyl-2-C-methyl-D-erythritol kinase